MPKSHTVWPTEIKVSKEKDELSVSFDNGTDYSYTAEYLRVMSPSAEVQGHSPEQRKTVGGKQNVGIMNVEAIGNYAVKISFNDGHSTGLYSWSYLYELGLEHDERWKEYLAELEAKGLSRS